MKFCWFLDAKFGDLEVNDIMVKVPNLPSLNIKEIQTEEGWIPGEQEWSPIEIIFWWSTSENATNADPIALYKMAAKQFETTSDFLGTITLRYLNPEGEVEKWTLEDAKFTYFNFGEESYSSRTEIEMSVTIQYKNAMLNKDKGLTITFDK